MDEGKYDLIILNEKASYNLYEVLNIDAKASRQQITERYRLMCRKYYVRTASGGTELIRLINKAYTVLRDDQWRQMHDAQLMLHNGAANKFKVCLMSIVPYTVLNVAFKLST